MAEIVTLPKLGLSEAGELVAWEVAVGDRVEAGDVLAVIESEKASAELESPAAGVLLATYVDAGEEIEIEPGRPMAAVGEEGESPPTPAEIDEAGDGDGESADAASEPAPEPTADDGTAAESSAVSATEASDSSGTTTGGPSAEPEQSDGITATPRARKLAREEGVDVAAVAGTGPRGAVTESDVERHLAGASSEPATGQSEEASGQPATTATAPTAGTNGQTVPEKVSPRARRYAEERGVDLAGIEGSGPQGSVVERDVKARAEAEPETEAVAEPEQEATPTAGSAAETAGGLTVGETRQLTGTRATIAERLSASAREKPHVTGTREISVEQLERVRERLAERGLEVSLNDLILHFVGETLRDFPAFNAHFEDGEHRLIEEVNVGYAVDGPRGLVVPVVENVAARSLESVAERRRELVDSVLDDDFGAEELQGGTFTVTNVGALGMDVSASIINPPEVAILAVGRAKPTPVERDGEVAFERAMTFSLTIDHRVLDGADSGAFLERLADYLEFPGSALEAVRR